MRAISWLKDSCNTVKKNFGLKKNQPSKGVSTDKIDSICYFSLCNKIQYLGMPDFRKTQNTFIDSAIIKIPKEDLSNSRTFYKKYYFQPYILRLNSDCEQTSDYKLIFSKPVYNILTMWIVPKYATANCERPKFGNIVTITFVYDKDDEILDYAIKSIIRN
jgi:hypothetical protein